MAGKILKRYIYDKENDMFKPIELQDIKKGDIILNKCKTRLGNEIFFDIIRVYYISENVDIAGQYIVDK